MTSPRGSESPVDPPDSPRGDETSKQMEPSPNAAVQRCEPPETWPKWSEKCACGEAAVTMDFDEDDVYYCGWCASIEGMLDAKRREGET